MSRPRPVSGAKIMSPHPPLARWNRLTWERTGGQLVDHTSFQLVHVAKTSDFARPKCRRSRKQVQGAETADQRSNADQRSRSLEQLAWYSMAWYGMVASLPHSNFRDAVTLGYQETGGEGMPENERKQAEHWICKATANNATQRTAKGTMSLKQSGF